MNSPILYLDYDGVLHAEDVRIVKRRPVIFENYTTSARPLFEHVPLLERLLAPYPELRIVLSTSWVRHLGFSYAKEQLSLGLQDKVIGACWHSHMRYENCGAELYDRMSRYEVICADAARRKNDCWVALDDNIDRWPENQYHRVVAPDHRLLALGQPGKADELARALRRLCLTETMRVTFRGNKKVSELDYGIHFHSKVQIVCWGHPSWRVSSMT